MFSKNHMLPHTRWLILNLVIHLKIVRVFTVSARFEYSLTSLIALDIILPCVLVTGTAARMKYSSLQPLHSHNSSGKRVLGKKETESSK